MTRNKWVSLALAFATFFIVPVEPAHANPFTATWTFARSPGNQTSEPVDIQPLGVFATSVTRGPGITGILGADTLNSSDWTLGSVVDLSNDFYEFAIAPATGHNLTLASLRFVAIASGAGPSSYEMRTSWDGFSAPLLQFGFLTPDTPYLSDIKVNARAYDAMIAATALANGLPVYTCNPNDFAGIDGLDVISVPFPRTSAGGDKTTD